jgi:adenylate cyclase
MARELADSVQRRMTLAVAGANAAGAVIVFVFASYALPVPSDVHDAGHVQLVNALVFVVAGSVAMVIGFTASGKLWRGRFAWARENREPTDAERERMLRYPLSQQWLNAQLWLVGAVIFTALNATFSFQGASDAFVTICIAGLVTCSASYLTCERLTRPLVAIGLSSGVPVKPQLPGVGARAALTWTLGTGAILLGIALIGIAGLANGDYSRRRLSGAVLAVAGIGLAVGIATTIGLARSLANPVRGLREALGRLEQGDLDVQVDVDDGSEVGLLQAGFNQMVAGLRERERLRDLFGRQVGEEVVRHALEHGVELGGEAREAAVLFVDLQGSTNLAATRDPAEVVDLLNAFFAIVVEVAGATGGWVNKFEGDAALCVWGAPLEDLDAAGHALATARALRRRLAEAEIVAGIGVSAGRVVAGNIGAAKRFEYTVIGDPVNEAARLTELAKGRPERLLVSDAALRRAPNGEAEQFERCDEVVLRGRNTPTTVAAPRA